MDPGLLMLLIMLKLGQIEERKHHQTPYHNKLHEQKQKQIQKKRGNAKRIMH